MANLVNQIEQSLPDGCFAKGRLRKKGCSVSLKDAPTPSITIDMDKPEAPVEQGETKCDYVFIGGCDDVSLAPLELTKQDFDTSKVVSQLQAGADIATTLIPPDETIQFQPVAFYKGKFHKAEKKELLKATKKIRFRGKSFNIRCLRCGSPLINALPKKGIK